MRVIIRFDKSAHRDPPFCKSILEQARKDGGTISVVGTFKGICIANLSWHDAFTLAAKMAILIRNQGIDAVNEAEIRIENDIAESDSSTFFNEWKGH